MDSEFKRLIIICEGQTEQQFCKEVMSKYFTEKKISIYLPLIKKSGGGIVHWEHLKKQIENHLKHEKKAHVTTLIDYYGIQEKHKFPKWSESKKISDCSKRMDFLEEAMGDCIKNSRFTPYLQLHEFEGLLFNNIEAFEEGFGEAEYEKKEIENIIERFPNPERINDGKDTAASKRLLKHIPGYDKVIYGSLLAQSIGLPQIRAKSPRFDGWVRKLENI